jgi:ribonuclease HII
MARRKPMYMPKPIVENNLRRQGFKLVAGLDEAGRGAWAGPLYAAAVILPLDSTEVIQRVWREGVRDGKRITPNRREMLYEQVIKEVAIGWGVGYATAGEVDDQGLTAATQLAMARALEKLSQQPDYLLIDGGYMKLPTVPLEQKGLTRGEREARCIAAASIAAKVERDRRMRELDERYPDYGFAQHKGYGTEAHRRALKRMGPCGEHRSSFKPIAELRSREAGSLR